MGHWGENAPAPPSHTLPFSYTNFPPYRGRGEKTLTLPPLGHFAPLLWPPLTNPGCTTVTGIAKMHKGPCSPLIGVKEIFKRGNIIYGIGTYATSHNYPLIMSFSVEENAVFIHEFSKKISLPWEAYPPPPPLARSARSGSVASLPRILPPPPPKTKSWLRH